MHKRKKGKITTVEYERRRQKRERRRLGMEPCWMNLPPEIWPIIKREYLKIIRGSLRARASLSGARASLSGARAAVDYLKNWPPHRLNLLLTLGVDSL